MKHIFLIFVTLFSLQAYSQKIDFKDDPESFNDWYDSIYDYKKINEQFDKEFKLTKDYDFELRLWIDPSSMMNRHLFVMKKKAGKWEAGFYSKNSGEMKETPVNQEELGELWSVLMRNEVLTLPDQENIRDKMRVYYPDTLAAQGIYTQLSGGPYYDPFIFDGVFYRVELRMKDKKRCYTYHCPKGYLKECPNVEELFRAYAIVYLVFRRIGWNPDDIC